jgi:hypothetical protein
MLHRTNILGTNSTFGGHNVETGFGYFGFSVFEQQRIGAEHKRISARAES